MKEERILRSLALNPKKKWKQKELVERVRCTKGHVSKVISKLGKKNMVTKIGRGETIVVDLPKMLNYWISIRKLPRPYYINENPEKIKKILKEDDLKYALTLFSAAWERIKLLKVKKIELYVLEKDLKKAFKILGKPSPYGDVEIYPCDEFIFDGIEKKGKLNLVSVVQNYVDLMHIGGNGTRVGLALARKFNVLGG